MVTSITNSVLSKSDNNAKKVNKWHIRKNSNKMIAATNLPATTSVLNALINILQWKFDFRKRFSANIEMLKVKNNKMKVFGLKATEAQVVMTIMANVEAATEHNYGQAFLVPLKTTSTHLKSTSTRMMPCPSSRCWISW
jgi:hypothetical protein